jgi:Arm DNA-binding domain
MKPRGKHPDRRLTDTWISAIRVPGRYSDGNGLYLVVSPSDVKRWIVRIVIDGQRRDLGLGSLSLVSLDDARQKARVLRRDARARVTKRDLFANIAPQGCRQSPFDAQQIAQPHDSCD